MGSILKCLCYTLVTLSTITGVSQESKEWEELKSTIDSIVTIGLDSAAYPGCQVLIAYQGEIILEKAYGYHTYDQKQEVKVTDLYDLASVTKVSSGLAVLMKLYGAGLFDLDAPFSTYYPEFKKSNKSDITYREMLSHQAQLQPYIVFWQNALKENGKFKRKSFRSKSNKKFNISITDSLYLHQRYKNQMVKEIKKSSLLDKKEYRYSGLLFLLMPDILAKITKSNFENYLEEFFYKPLGIKRLLYNPLNRFNIEEIVPTENDTFFRKQLVRGHVHDEAAAMLNGVSCNAGLFGNAHDLSILFQMYLNGGEYNGKRYIPESAISEFTRYQYPESNNRRGIGFDKPMIEYNSNDSYVARDASANSFGHSGFTGTFVWADPDHELLVIFLSNRVYPTRANSKLYSLGIRPKLHQAVYDAIKENNK